MPVEDSLRPLRVSRASFLDAAYRTSWGRFRDDPDYALLLSGECDLELDSGEVAHLKPGDVVVRAARCTPGSTTGRPLVCSPSF